ncbi:hypothetical protein A8P48_13245 [Yersinia pestis]|nr:hypothetical protein AU254_13210 [Yersinia pestis]PCN65910.1 hypothetical protein A8P48_13245 [Yersinia pestis]PVU30614.1 hypothetical protein A8M58_13085 [Yersinia pestis]PVU31893.1 hypothetical protein A8M56_00605 [Yersinia pestis]
MGESVFFPDRLARMLPDTVWYHIFIPVRDKNSRINGTFIYVNIALTESLLYPYICIKESVMTEGSLIGALCFSIM